VNEALPLPSTDRLGIRDTSVPLKKKKRMSIEHEGDDAKRWIGDRREKKKKKKKKRRPRVTPQRPSLRDVDERLGDDYATGEELG